MRAKLIIAAATAATALASCNTAPPAPLTRTPRQQELFNRLTMNKVPGPPGSCVPSFNQHDMSIVDGRTLIFGTTVGQTNVVTLSPGCESLDRSMYALQTNNWGQGMCVGDIARVIDPSMNGMTVGSCVVRAVTPYNRPRRP